jgi:hypothetical protein
VVGLSRRRFLGLAGALAGAWLTGCGRDEAKRPPVPDRAVLARLLARERATIAAAGAASGAVAAIRAHDLAHARRLRAALARLGGARAEPVPPARSLAASAQQGVYAYVDALPQLADPGLRALVLELAAGESAHLALLRLDAGDAPVPDAFAGFGPVAP